MRSIEDLAAEEDARLREEFSRNLEKVLFVTALGLGIWGWLLFYRGQTGKGALVLIVSFLLLTVGLGGRFKISFLDGFLALVAGLPPLFFYYLTRLPSFNWGHDPAFWLSIHAGAVTEPFWSPLAYLAGQAACFLLPQRQWTLPTELSAAAMALALILAMLEFLFLFKNKTLLNVLLGWMACWLLAVSHPFWSAATQASGLVASLGLILFLTQKSLSRQGNPSAVGALLSGLLWSVHPLWGVLALASRIGSWGGTWKDAKRGLLAFVAGLTPYLWVVLRAGKFFPSWGGDHPWREAWQEGWGLVQAHFQGDWSPLPALTAWGWIIPLIGVLVIPSAFLYFFKWRTSHKPLMEAAEFWVWVFSGAAGFLSFSLSSEALGGLSLFFGFGLMAILLRLVERGTERRQSAYLTGVRLEVTALLGLMAGFGLAFLPGQACFRSSYFFPQQHALNLLRTLEGRSVLVSDDPFEVQACLEAKLFDPTTDPSVVLDENYLSRRWYVGQCAAQVPELLFSSLVGTPEGLLKSLVLANRDSWNIHWSRSVLPAGWGDVPASPTVLTQFFTGARKPPVEPEDLQYRLDLTALPKKGELTGGQADRYFFRYTEGFNELGKNLMNRGFYLASIQAFDRASRLDPSFSEPQSFLAQMYSQQKILEAAQLTLERTIKTQPRKIGDLMVALEKAQKDVDEPQCLKLLDEMVRQNTDLAEAQYQLSVIYRRQGRIKDADGLLESSLELNPKQIEAQLTRGHLMAKMGNRLKAEEAFRAVLVLNPENKEAQVELWKLLNKP